MAECLFCRLAADRDFPTRHRDDTVIAFDDIDPKAPIHVLIVPIEHIASARELDDPNLLGALFRVAHQVAAVRGLDEGGYRLVFNVGPDAGQTVFHAHLHLLGGRKFTWPPG